MAIPAEFPPGLRAAFQHLITEANKAGWVVWVPQADESVIDGFVCGNEQFLKRVGIGLKRSELSAPVDPPEQSH
jgi:hypothetical protein